MTTGNYKAQVMFEPQNYMLGALTQQTSSPLKYNTHIQIPVGAQFGRKLVIDFIGVGDASEPDYWETTVPCLQGTCLVSAVFAASEPNATFGQMSVLGGPTDSTGMSPGGFANTLVNFTGLTVVCPWNSQQFGVDGRNLAQMNVPNGSYLAFAPVNFNGARRSAARTCGKRTSSPTAYRPASTSPGGTTTTTATPGISPLKAPRSAWLSPSISSPRGWASCTAARRCRSPR